MSRIGLLGGTFDPVHNAHLAIASQAQAQFELAKVIFIPTGTPVRKVSSTVASASDRLAMLRLACAEIPTFEVSTVETDRPGLTYTIDTLHYLVEELGSDCELFFITGKDTTVDMPTWKDAREIAGLVTVLSANRGAGKSKPESDPAVLLDDFRIIDFQIPDLAISSSEIRQRIKAGLDVADMVPAAVLGYIRKHALYD